MIKPWHGVRWWICGLLFSATVLGYIDRSLISILKADLHHDLHWTEIDYGHVVAAFSLAYAVGQLLSGRLMDVIGARWGFAIAVGLWSIAAMSHAVAMTLAGFCIARFALGLAEGGNFPGAAKTVSEWFPKRERALATGIFNSGCTVGTILTPIVVTFVTLQLGISWRYCFVAMGLAGLMWLPPWVWMYRSPQRHPLLSPAELAHITADAADPAVKISWGRLLGFRATWAFIIGIMLTSPIWWFYLYWFPDFLEKAFHLDKQQRQWPVVVVYLVAGVGSVAGGWISGALIRRGRTINQGRKVAMLLCVLAVVPVYFAPRTAGTWSATVLVALAAAAHQGWASNLYTLVSDTMPRFAVSSVVGIGGMVAGFVAMGFQEFSSHLLESRHAAAYPILFGICSGAYPVALLFIHLLIPQIKPVTVSSSGDEHGALL